MQKNILPIVIILIIVACGHSGEEEQDFASGQALLESLPTVTPNEITQFNAADTLFFQHLAYTSVANDDGTVVLGDRERQFIIQVDSSGALVRQMARAGRGPGEVLDMTMTKTPEGGIIAYDQTNMKLVRFDADMKFREDLPVTPPEKGGMLQFFKLNNDEFLGQGSTNDWIFDKEEEHKILLARYNSGTDTYEDLLQLQGKKYARLVIDGRPRGGAVVPYRSSQVVRYNPDEQTLWTMWTGSGVIAEMSPDFDTLQTVTVDLPQQELSSAEMDTLENTYGERQWKTMQPALPQQKVAVEDMHVDWNGRFWLQLNYRSDYQLWLITDRDGTPQKIVHLPKGTMLTHVSEHHLGVRIGPGTFALYEPVD